jgi:uncharacterized protein HemX
MDSTIIAALIGLAGSALGSAFVYFLNKGNVEKEFAVQDTLHTSSIDRLKQNINELKEDIRENQQEIKNDLRELRTETREETKELVNEIEKLNVKQEDLATKHRSLVNKLASEGILKSRGKGDKETLS